MMLLATNVRVIFLPKVEMVGLQTLKRLLEHLHGEGAFASVSANLGHEKTLSRLPLRAMPIQSSLLPRWYSQQLSKKGMPQSMASWTMAVAVAEFSASPR